MLSLTPYLSVILLSFVGREVSAKVISILHPPHDSLVRIYPSIRIDWRQPPPSDQVFSPVRLNVNIDLSAQSKYDPSFDGVGLDVCVRLVGADTWCAPVLAGGTLPSFTFDDFATTSSERAAHIVEVRFSDDPKQCYLPCCRFSGSCLPVALCFDGSFL